MIKRRAIVKKRPNQTSAIIPLAQMCGHQMLQSRTVDFPQQGCCCTIFKMTVATGNPALHRSRIGRASQHFSIVIKLEDKAVAA